MIEGIKIGLEVGDIEYACHNAVNYCNQFMLIGNPLEVVAQKQLHYLEITVNFRQDISDNYLSLSRQLVLNLLGRAADKTILVGQAFNEDEMVPNFLKKGQFYHICATYYFLSSLRIPESQAQRHSSNDGKRFLGVVQKQGILGNKRSAN